MVTEAVTEPRPVTNQETPIFLTEILTDQNDIKDIINDEDIIQETYKTIFTSDPALSKPLTPQPDNVTYETIFFGPCAVKPPPTLPPLPHLPNSIIASNNRIMPIEIDQTDQIDNLLPMGVDNTLPAFFWPSLTMEIDYELNAASYIDEVLALTYIDKCGK